MTNKQWIIEGLLASLIVSGLWSCKTASDPSNELQSKPAASKELEIGSLADLPKAKAKGLQMRIFASDGIEKYLAPADGSNGLPESMQGIWWLDGNPQPGSVLLSLQTAKADAATKEFVWKFSEPGHYTFTANADGLKDFGAGLQAGSGYRLSYSKDGREIRIKAVITIFGHDIILPRGISDFTATLAEDGHWVRHSKVFGIIKAADYDMRRIVDGKGQRVEPAYSNYLKAAGSRCYLVESIKP